MVTHCSILAWRIPWTKEPGRLQSMGVTRVGHNLVAKPPLPPQCCIHSSVDGFLGCFQVLPIVKRAAVNIGVHVSLSVMVF